MTHPRLVGNRYELRELIGYGGMAEVHRGKDVRLGAEAFAAMQPDLDTWRGVKAELDPGRVFQSDLARRLGL